MLQRCIVKPPTQIELLVQDFNLRSVGVNSIFICNNHPYKNKGFATSCGEFNPNRIKKFNENSYLEKIALLSFF